MSFMCDECDGLIRDGEVYMNVYGLNYCETCMDSKYMKSLFKKKCYCCEKEIKPYQWFVKFEDDIICEECFDKEKTEITEGEED